MHRTLKAETTRPAGKNLLQQQERFDAFRVEFNEVRPHEALGQIPPARVYEPSSRSRSDVAELEYPLHDDVRMVDSSGHISVLRKRGTDVFLSSALTGYPVGLRETKADVFLISFAHLDLGEYDLKTKTFQPIERKVKKGKGEKVLPMSPV